MQERLKKIAPIFQKFPSPISVAIRMAQFILESNAGQSELFKKSNNGFGIKASAPWTGDKVLHNSEEADGQIYQSYFRKYPNLEESIKDHASFFTSTPYRENIVYKSAIEATTYQEEARSLTGTYATDPIYGDKLIQIIEKYDLTQYNISDGIEWKPTIIDRRDQALGGQNYDRPLSQITTIVWHYTAVPRRYRRKIWDHEQYWKNSRGWNRGGYHYYIDSDGVLYQNYNLERVTWGVADNNSYTVHISVEANSKDDYSAEQIKTRDWITRKLMKELKIDASHIKGHWEVNNNTSCPGYNKQEMEQYRKELAKPLSPSSICIEDKIKNKDILEKDNYLILRGKKYKVIEI